MSPTPRSRALRALLPLAVGLVACSAPTPPTAQNSNLFSEVYSDVAEYHLTDPTADHLALAGLAKLSTIDPKIAVGRSGGDVVLSLGDKNLHFAAPPPQDDEGWGDLTKAAIAAARAGSPPVAALDPDRLDETVISGSLATLDRFSRYVRPAIAREHRAMRDGFVGIGVTLTFDHNDVRITEVFPDTPAALAGIQPADRIIAIDGTQLHDLSPEALRTRLSGAANTPLTLQIARAGRDDYLTMTMRRTLIVEPTVSLAEHDGIAWLKVTSFNQRTAETAAELLHRAHAEMGAALRGIVLDLRGNPGGLLDQSVDLAGLFLTTGTVSSTVGRVADSNQVFTVPPGGRPETLPVAVLVNGGSASASEVVTAALQDDDRAVVIGTSSFGKGTVQTVLRTENGGELTVTWAQLIAPRGYHLHHHGVVPTICTSGAGSGDAAELAANPPAALEEPRERLDDAGWTALRARCPPQTTESSLDERVARRVIADPRLYRAALETQAQLSAAAR